jgi:hypothetical protein
VPVERGVPTAAKAGPPSIADKQAQATQLQSDIERTNEELSAMGERYNGAQLRFEETEARVVAIEAEVAANEREVDGILGLVNERSASVYRRALTGESLDDLDNSDSSKLVVRKHYAAIQARRDARLLDQLEEARTWGRSASTHVALYYGNAQILESGGSGHDVHIGPIWGTPMGAARVLQ